MLPPELPLNSEERLYDTIKTGHSRRIPETLINLEESADYGCGEPGVALAATDLPHLQQRRPHQPQPELADGGT